MHQSAMGQLGAGRPASLELLELIAVFRIVEEVGEVVEELHSVANDIGGETGRVVRPRALPVERAAVAKGLAPVGLLDEPEPADQPAVDGALRNLVGRVPVVPVSQKRQRDAVAGVSLRVSDDAVVLVFVVRAHPRTVVPLPLERGEQIAGAALWVRLRPGSGRSRRNPQ